MSTFLEWVACSSSLPAEGEVVHTKIDDVGGMRNDQKLKRSKNLWFFPDGSMYVYYTPTHWAKATPPQSPSASGNVGEEK